MRFVWLAGALVLVIFGSPFVVTNSAEAADDERCRKLASAPSEYVYQVDVHRQSLYREGVDFDKIELELAHEACSAAAKRANATAADQFRLGRVSLAKKSYAEAIDWTRKSADQNYAPAQLGLGIMYANGEGVEKNAATAVEWFRKAAGQGNADAQFSLGFIYATGAGVEKNGAMAEEWYRKAGYEGYAEAYYNLGVMYEFGDGVPKHREQARELYMKALQAGHKKAAERYRDFDKKPGQPASAYSKNDGSGTAAAVLGGILLWSILSGANSDSEKNGETDRTGKKCHLVWQHRDAFSSNLGHGDESYTCDLDELKSGRTCSRQVEVCN